MEREPCSSYRLPVEFVATLLLPVFTVIFHTKSIEAKFSVDRCIEVASLDKIHCVCCWHRTKLFPYPHVALSQATLQSLCNYSDEFWTWHATTDS